MRRPDKVRGHAPPERPFPEALTAGRVVAMPGLWKRRCIQRWKGFPVLRSGLCIRQRPGWLFLCAFVWTAGDKKDQQAQIRYRAEAVPENGALRHRNPFHYGITVPAVHIPGKAAGSAFHPLLSGRTDRRCVSSDTRFDASRGRIFPQRRVWQRSLCKPRADQASATFLPAVLSGARGRGLLRPGPCTGPRSEVLHILERIA